MANNNCDTPELVSYDDALQHLLDTLQPVCATETLPLLDTLGRVITETLQSDINVPSMAVSSMDGYAINSADLAETTNHLPVTQRIPAGSAGKPLQRATAARIFTGAPVPQGADAVIIQEDVQADENGIHFDGLVESGLNVRPAGNDIHKGRVILSAGTRLRPQDLGIAASVGLSHLPVYRPLKVGLFSTGDELATPGEPLKAGQIYESNRYVLRGFLSSLGCEVVDLGLIGDTLDATCGAMQEASRKADLVITTGGVSVGEEDHVRIALQKLGDLSMWRLNIKPGKPLAFGLVNGSAFMGLPGNPVSVFATFCLFVVPAIARLQGKTWEKPPAVHLRAAFDWPKADRRREFLRARLAEDNAGQSVVEIYPNQDSGVLTSTVWADGFVEVAESCTIARGDMVNYISFTSMVR